MGRVTETEIMTSDKLVPYWVRLRDTKKPGIAVEENDYWDLTELQSENPGFREYESFLDYFENHLQKLEDDGHFDDTMGKSLAVRRFKRADQEWIEGDDYWTSPPLTVEGVLALGDFGRAADHLDREAVEDDGLEPAEARDEDARDHDIAEEDRLYFLLHIPRSEPSRGMLMLHSYGRTGVKTILRKTLRKNLESNYREQDDDDRGLKFRMNTVADKPMIERLREVDINGFEVVKRNVSAREYAQESDAIGGTSDSKANAKFSVKVGDWEIDRDRLAEMVNQNEYPFAEMLDGEVNKANALITTENGNERKLNLTKNDVRMEKIIDTDIRYENTTGRPKFHTVGRVARELVNEQLTEYGCKTLDTERSLLDTRILIGDQ